jgi:conjugative transposon TraJ protein
MVKWKVTALFAVAGMFWPFLSQAQGITDEMNNLHGVLDQLYNEMIPLCSQLIGVGQGIAGFAATWYIASRVWRHIANAEPIDFYPLFRPFVLGFCVMIFPSVLAMMNGILKPTVTGTSAMVENSNKALSELLKRKEQAVKNSPLGEIYMANGGEGDRDKWYKYTYGEDADEEAWYAGIGNDLRFAMSKQMFAMQNKVKHFLSEILQVLFAAAALCINTLRTFQLVVLAILGPLVFGIAVFDGFQHTLTAWISKYINVFLWLPIANIFGAIIGKIQEKMVEMDIGQIQQSGDTFFSSTDVAYLVFMIIGIVGYFTVPSIANNIINAGGGGAMTQKITSLMSSTAGAPMSAATSAIDTKKSFDDGRKYDAGTGISGAIGRMAGSGKSDGGYQHSKLSGRQE